MYYGSLIVAYLLKFMKNGMIKRFTLVMNVEIYLFAGREKIH